MSAQPPPPPRPAVGCDSSSAGALLTADALAERWQVPVSQVYALTRAGRVPTVRLGRYYRYSLTAIAEWEAAGGSSSDA